MGYVRAGVMYLRLLQNRLFGSFSRHISAPSILKYLEYVFRFSKELSLKPSLKTLSFSRLLFG